MDDQAQRAFLKDVSGRGLTIRQALDELSERDSEAIWRIQHPDLFKKRDSEKSQWPKPPTSSCPVVQAILDRAIALVGYVHPKGYPEMFGAWVDPKNGFLDESSLELQQERAAACLKWFTSEFLFRLGNDPYPPRHDKVIDSFRTMLSSFGSPAQTTAAIMDATLSLVSGCRESLGRANANPLLTTSGFMLVSDITYDLPMRLRLPGETKPTPAPVAVYPGDE